MKKAALLLVFALAAPAWAQDAKPPAKEEAKPAAPAQEAAKPAAQEPAKPAPKKHAAGSKSRRQQDARHCLEKPTNTEIIKCAEAYL